MNLYNYQGIRLNSSFYENIDIDYEFDSSSNANYTVIRVYKKKADGSNQYPFVYAPNGNDAGTMSTLSMATRYGWSLSINAGVFNTSNKKPDGIVIQDGLVIQSTIASIHAGAMPLTVDSNGDLSYAATDASASSLVSNGVVSAVCGFTPIITDYEPYSESGSTENAQRQIIGQFGNGDYAIVTCEGRNYDHSDGWTTAESVAVCQRLGLKFAYNLDGGGSTETVLGEKQINTIYEGTYGRIVPTFIVFNGKDEFEIPNP